MWAFDKGPTQGSYLTKIQHDLDEPNYVFLFLFFISFTTSTMYTYKFTIIPYYLIRAHSWERTFEANRR